MFEYLDDTPWPPVAARPMDQKWSDYRVEASEARAEVVNALVGGRDIGHTHDTIERRLAETLWETMESQFGSDRDYYIRLGFGRRDHVYQRGAVIIDRTRAGVLFVVEND